MDQRTVLIHCHEYNVMLDKKRKLLKTNYMKYLSQHKPRVLAEKSGVKVGTIYQIKKPHADYVPDFMLGLQLCYAMGIDIETIMKGKGG